MSLFAKQRVNRGRQPEIDALKATCILCMIALHCFEELGCGQSVLYAFVDWMCALLGAAAFMFCMGLGMRYSRHQAPGFLAARGLELLTVGQFLNLVRNALPNLIAWWIKGEQFYIANALLVVQADILSFAGLAFLLLALMKKLRASDGAILIVGFVMNVAAYLISDPVPAPSNYLLSQLLGYFVLTNAEAYFPLASYFVFVAAGYYVGGWYPRIRDKKALANRVLLIGLPVGAAYYALRLNGLIPGLPRFYSYKQYILQPGPDAVATMLASTVYMAASWRLIDRFGGRMPGIVSHTSANITQYYCVSYVLIMPLQTLLIATRGELLTGRLLPALIALAVIAACYWIIELNERGPKWHLATLTGMRRRVVFAAIWIMSFAVVAYAYPRIETCANFWNDYLLP